MYMYMYTNKMLCRQVDWKRIVFVYYILQLFSLFTDASHKVHVKLHAPHYVMYRDTATLICNHSVPETNLRKIEFFKDAKRILQYVKEMKPPFRKSHTNGMNLEHSMDGKTIILRDVGFEASGTYSCEVATATPIYEQESNLVEMQVFVPQKKPPHITFEKEVYVVGEYLEANCTSAPAYPVPHLTWFINGKEVDISLVTLYPYRSHEGNLQSATAKLKIKVSELHVGDNGRLEIKCRSTIPGYAIHHFADVQSKTVPVEIIPAPVATSSTKRLNQELVLVLIAPILCTTCKVIPL